MKSVNCHQRLNRDVAELFSTNFCCSAAQIIVHQTSDSLSEPGSILLETHIFEGPYRDGIFTFYFNIPPNYPFKAVEVSAMQRIWHPNIDPHSGRVAIPLEWSPVLTLHAFALAVQMLMLEPAAAVPLNLTAYSHYTEDPDTFDRLAQASIRSATIGGIHYVSLLDPKVAARERELELEMDGEWEDDDEEYWDENQQWEDEEVYSGGPSSPSDQQSRKPGTGQSIWSICPPEKCPPPDFIPKTASNPLPLNLSPSTSFPSSCQTTSFPILPQYQQQNPDVTFLGEEPIGEELERKSRKRYCEEDDSDDINSLDPILDDDDKYYSDNILTDSTMSQLGVVPNNQSVGELLRMQPKRFRLDITGDVQLPSWSTMRNIHCAEVSTSPSPSLYDTNTEKQVTCPFLHASV